MKFKLYIINWTVVILLLLMVTTIVSCHILDQTGIPIPNLLTNSAESIYQRISKDRAISTDFEHAKYEATFLTDFEPTAEEYRPLSIQPQDENGNYELSSGLYLMTAKSFCLKAGTHGPSRGDGHLYAPLKGKQANFVEAILQRYSQHPEISQRNIQTLLWAIVAGADLNKLANNHQRTLEQLFSVEERIKYQGGTKLRNFALQQLNQIKPKLDIHLQKIIEADNKIRSMVTQNMAYQQLESVAILSGVAPRDLLVREVSKGRWSYHPDGYFIRFFPQGYRQSQVDIYVPKRDAVKIAGMNNAVAIDPTAVDDQKVRVNLAANVAAPANRGGQRIGYTPIPVKPCEEQNISEEDLSQDWKRKARENLAAYRPSDVTNQPVTCAYVDLYLSDPKRFKWAGLAAIVSGEVGNQLKDWEKWKDYSDNVESFLDDIAKGNRAVFDDLYWQHLAYSENGITEIEKLYCQGHLSDIQYSAWRKIDDDNVWEGNLMLLYHEQKKILQPAMYANNSNFWDLANNFLAEFFNGEVLVSPVPGDNSTFPADNISNFLDRWRWIEQTIVPNWRRFEEHPANHSTLLDVYRGICSECCVN